MVHIEEVKNVPTGIQPEAKEISKKEASNVDKYNDLLSTMQKTKEKWDEEDGVEDEKMRYYHRLLSSPSSKEEDGLLAKKMLTWKRYWTTISFPPCFARRRKSWRKRAYKKPLPA
jgi:hypothetical protein